MTSTDIQQLLSLLARLDSEAKSLPDDLLQLVAMACQSGSSTMWSEVEDRNEGLSEFSGETI